VSREPRSYEEVKALAATLRRRIETVIALHENTDPYFAGAPRRLERAEWFAALWDKLDIKSAVHVRSIHYRLISQKTPVLMPNGERYENTLRCYAALNEAARDARYLELIEANTIIDRRNPRPVINLDDEEGSSAEIGIGRGKISRQPFGSNYRAPTFVLPSLVLYEPTVPQRYHLEIWCEKSTMNDVLMPLGREYRVNVATFSGECSTTACEDLIRRAIASGKAVRIFHVTDFDPRGETMPISAACKIDFLAKQSGQRLDIRLVPVALTLQQCIDYGLPRTPIKKTEGMGADFEARYGEGATELDALEALHPGALREILVAEIERYVDANLADEVEDVVSEVRTELRRVESGVCGIYASEIAALNEQRDAINLVFRQVHDPAWVTYEAVCREARTTFEAAVEQVRDEIMRMERDFIERAEPVIETINSMTEQESPDPDRFDWPEPAEADEDDDPLYDSSRSYLEQVDRFRSHKGREDDPTVRRLHHLTCEVCGNGFTSPLSTARACGNTCRERRRLKRCRGGEA
jgi:hypothetical protein